MMCRPHGWAAARGQDEELGGAAAATRSPDDRVGDRERSASADRLAAAYAEGLLDTAEFDEQVRQAYGAVTVAELRRAEQPLSEGFLAELHQRQVQAAATERRAASWRAELRAYTGVMLLLVAIWAVSALTAGASYPWPLWPALGWGVPLLLSRPRDGRGRRPGQAVPGGGASTFPPSSCALATAVSASETRKIKWN